MIARIPLKGGDTPDKSEINSMIERYDKMTNFLWPSNWTSLVRVLYGFSEFFYAKAVVGISAAR